MTSLAGKTILLTGALQEIEDREMALVTLIEPDRGSNIVTRNLDYLLTRLEAGIEDKQIELGGKHFASLIS